MRRLLISLTFVILILLAAVWLIQHPGYVAIIWLGYKIDLPIAILFMGLLVSGGCLLFLDRIWRYLRRLPTDMLGGWSASRRSQGYQAVTKSLVAISAGDLVEATEMIQQSEKKLGDDYPLTKLVRAQIGLAAKDEAVSSEAYALLAENPETAFLGLRGLTEFALQSQDIEQATRFAEQALVLRPGSEWAMKTCLRLRAYLQQWELAHGLLKQMQKKQILSAASAQRQKAFLLYLESRQLAQDGVLETARKKAKLCYDTCPEFVYGLKQYMALLAQTGQTQRISKLLEKHWCQFPHQICYDLMKEYHQDRSEGELLAHLQSLKQKMTAHILSAPKNHIIVLLVDAQAGLAAHDSEITRAALQKLRDYYHYETAQTLKLWALLVRLETGQQPELSPEGASVLTNETGSEDVTRPLALSVQTSYDYLIRSIDQLDQSNWHCHTCHQVQSNWQVFCDHCHDFDSLSQLDQPSPLADLQAVEPDKIQEE